jgi:gliding motility-associated protein GldE
LEDLPELIIKISIFLHSFNVIALIESLSFIILILISALISGSEVAYFSLTPNILTSINKNNKAEKNILKLLEKPDLLLATILITNNFVNIAIVILATYITASLINFHNNQFLKFLIEGVVVTFLILLFGEIIPKIYANKYKKKFAAFMAYPLIILEKIFYPLAELLAKSTNIVNKRIQNKSKLSMSDISYAIDITSGQSQNEKKILKNVVNLSNIEAREIMTPRVDVVTVDYYDKLSVVKKIIAENEFSRLPVVKDSLDNIVGILYIKDILKIIKKENYFEWQKIIKPAYFVPENKKIDDLLQEFREKKIHLAVVSDEYAGFSGILTLEDIIEEIVGEINDEYDIPEHFLKKISENQYIVEGKLLLNDLQKTLGLPENFFDEIKTDVETVAGLILEITEDFPVKNQKIKFKNLTLTVAELTNRRIVKVIIKINTDNIKQKI